MRPLPAYLIAVLTASFVLSVEWFSVSTVMDLATGRFLSLGRFRDGLLAMVTLLPLVIFGVAVLLAALPFLLFYPSYRKQRGSAARNAAMVFGVIVAFAGLSLTLGTLAWPPGVDAWELGQYALLGLLPGLASGWVFHKAMSLPASEPATGGANEGQVS